MEKNKKKTLYKIVGLALAVLAVALLIFAIYPFPPAAPSDNAVNLNSNSTQTEEAPLEENPIDFLAEAEKYPDIYAWIKVSGTDIDFPVVQHPTDDFYYLDHDATGEPENDGAIYTQLCNSKNMQDPVTVIYGHDMNLSGAMFNQLHLFEDPEFFDENEYFEIYIPGKILRYRIISAYMSDDRHIMNSFDFENETTRKQYYDSVCHPVSMIVNVREGAELDLDDKIVQLSTCMSSAAIPNSRYILTGVLCETRLTK